MAATEAANAHYRNGHHQQQPGPSLPASPTLTNPDMILPDYPRSDSPDPDIGARDHSSLMMWNNVQSGTSSTDLHHMFVATGLVGQAVDHSYGAAGPVTPTTPIIYGNGTMLSDIGEVTEVESTVGKPSPAWTKPAARKAGSPAGVGSNDAALRSSPTMGAAAMIKKKSKQSLKAKRERRASIESTSTITTEDRGAIFADFDDTASVGDSVFQGDDEESLASSYVEGTAAIEPVRLGVAKIQSLDRLSTYSTTSLSRRAEEILANAKKRLTTMEGNLTRARGSLHDNSPYGSEGSTPSPPVPRASTAQYSGDSGMDSGAPASNHTSGHTRISSDVARQIGLTYQASLPRSQSALGAAGGYRQPLVSSKSADHIRQKGLDDESGRPAFSIHPVGEGGPKPLTEDEVARLEGPDRESHNARLEAFLSPTFGSFSDGSVRTLQRSSSAAQVRDIKDQMRDLKGKISSLREQARVDNLKRRSLQSLRTPSPFTHAQVDQWYAEPQPNRTSEVVAGSLPGRNPWNGEESSVDGDAKEDALQLRDGDAEEDTGYDGVENEAQLEQPASHSPEPDLPYHSAVEGDANEESDDDGSDMLTENGDMGEEQEETFHDVEDADYMSESGESLYHDSVQHQISHEDREDAFDYEHFFLHSAMGSMSRRHLERRGSVGSFTSEDSVETTRGPVANGANGVDLDHGAGAIYPLARRESSASVSTVGTFATALEHRSIKSPEIPDEASLGSDGSLESLSRASSVQSTRRRSGSTATAKRFSLVNAAAKDSDGSISPIAEEGPGVSTFPTNRRASVIHRPLSTPATATLLHRPSTASFDSMGTSRSFPLVNKPPPKANSTGVLTPRDSPDQDELRSLSARLLSGTVSACESRLDEGAAGEASNGIAGPKLNSTSTTPQPLDALLREDKYLVERVVASLGKCVLGLTENGRASAESRMFRRRIDAARRILEEGIEGE